MNENFSKDAEILFFVLMEVKNSINQIKNKVESINNRLDQGEEKASGIEDKVEEILHSCSNDEKNR
jgi:phage-related protein